MIVCLGIGFIFGYILNSQNNSIIKSSGDTTILDEAYHILKNRYIFSFFFLHGLNFHHMQDAPDLKSLVNIP